jgi:hypothetical protein
MPSNFPMQGAQTIFGNLSSVVTYFKIEMLYQKALFGQVIQAPLCGFFASA